MYIFKLTLIIETLSDRDGSDCDVRLGALGKPDNYNRSRRTEAIKHVSATFYDRIKHIF